MPLTHILQQGFRGKPASSDKQDHWIGGDGKRLGEQCPTCKKPYHLLWDLNTSDPRFQLDERKTFPKWGRIPLVYCWRCIPQLSYRILRGGKIDIVEHDGLSQGSKFPYKNYPTDFKRRPLKLQPIPYKIEKTRLALRTAEEWVTKDDKAIVSKWLGKKVTDGSDTCMSQFGGLPYLIQEDPDDTCPRKCKNIADMPNRMSLLAAVHDDSIEEMIEPKNGNLWVQVIFLMCNKCLAISVYNACD